MSYLVALFHKYWTLAIGQEYTLFLVKELKSLDNYSLMFIFLLIKDFKKISALHLDKSF